MRKQAEQLVVGRVYADIESDNENVKSTFFEYLGKENTDMFFKLVGGCREYYSHDVIEDNSKRWYELTPEEDAIYNKPSEPTFILSDIQQVIEKIEREANFITDNDDISDKRWKRGMLEAIKIMREEFKIKQK